MTSAQTISYVPTVEHRENEICVTVKVAGIEVDRPEQVGYVVTSESLAQRLSAAITAGAVFHDPEVRTDVNGRTYVVSKSRVLARMMSADLKRLGF